MRSWLRHHVRTIIVVLTITLLLSTLPSATFAQGRPTVTVTGSGTDTCDGRPVASVVQGEGFNVGVADFPTAGGGGITFTLPDGRIRDPGAAFGFGGVALGGLGAVPLSFPYPAVPGPPTYFAPVVPGPVPGLSATNKQVAYTSHVTWPTGCYTVTVSVPPFPAAPNLRATAQFRLLPRPFSAQAGNLKLWVQAATGQATGVQTFPFLPVNIFGQGVPSTSHNPAILGPTPPGVTINIVQPNEAIIGPFYFPSVADGSFTLPYGFGFLHQTGVYTVYATVSIPPAVLGGPDTIYTAKAQFNLKAFPAPVPAIAATNSATLTMLDRSLVPQGTPLSFVARGFSPVPLPLMLVLPNGVRIPLPLIPVSADGNAAIGPLVLGNGFPTGTYQMTANQPATAVNPARTATTTWRMIPQQP